jgi:hypothetical protein
MRSGNAEWQRDVALSYGRVAVIEALQGGITASEPAPGFSDLSRLRRIHRGCLRNGGRPTSGGQVNCVGDRERFTSVPAVRDFEGETIETRSSRRAANWMPAIIRC